MRPLLSRDLTQLLLAGSAEVQDELLRGCFKHCLALEAVDMYVSKTFVKALVYCCSSGCLAVTDSVIAEASSLPQLTSFLAARTQFGDISANSFMKHATSLTQLDVSRCRLLSPNAFASLVVSLPSIRRIAALGAPCTTRDTLAVLPTTLTALDWSRSKTQMSAFTLVCNFFFFSPII